MATVTCTQRFYFYINDELVSSSRATKSLTSGLTFTPSHANHMPSYDEDLYTDYYIEYNGDDYTVGSLTCPSSNFTVYYYFYGYEEVEEWMIGATPEYLNTSSTVEKYLSFGMSGYVARIKVSFTTSGTATFYATGSYDTYGYLSTVSTLNSSTGGPTTALKSDDDSGTGSNFKFTYSVKSGTTYYLWVRMYDITDTGTTTVYIEPPPSWKFGALPEYLETSSAISHPLSFGTAGYVTRMKVSFVDSGTATFYTTGNLDTYGYLSTVSTLDAATGAPTTILVSNDDGDNGTNCKFTYEVTAGTTYYFWIRPYGINATGTTTACVTPPTPTWKYGALPEYLNTSSAVSHALSFGTPGYVTRMKISFVNSGTATFYTTGNSDTYGYLSTVSTLDPSTGGPTTILTSDDDSGDSMNCSFTYNVTAGTTYYFWIRLIDITSTGTTTACVKPPPSVKPWDWNASNGSASASSTKAAYTAVTTKGETTAFSYLVWNDLVDKVLEALAAEDESWNTNGSKYLSAASTKMTSSDKKLTAARFNALRWNIGTHYSTEITDRSKGDPVLGEYFTILTSSLNSWIATIT